MNLLGPDGLPLGLRSGKAPEIGSPTPLGPLVHWDHLPITGSGTDMCLYAAQFAGPETGLDHRVYLDRRAIGDLLDACKASPTGRCIVSMAGIRVESYESRTGSRHPWTRYVIIGQAPKPEEGALATAGTTKRLNGGGETWTTNPTPDPDSILVHVETVGGPRVRRDYRLYFDNIERTPEGAEAYRPLTRLLTMANASPKGRVMLPMVGVREKAHRAKSGHVYKVWTLIHRKAIVERMSAEA